MDICIYKMKNFSYLSLFTQFFCFPPHLQLWIIIPIMTQGVNKKPEYIATKWNIYIMLNKKVALTNHIRHSVHSRPYTTVKLWSYVISWCWSERVTKRIFNMRKRQRMKRQCIRSTTLTKNINAAFKGVIRTCDIMMVHLLYSAIMKKKKSTMQRQWFCPDIDSCHVQG